MKSMIILVLAAVLASCSSKPNLQIVNQSNAPIVLTYHDAGGTEIARRKIGSSFMVENPFEEWSKLVINFTAHKNITIDQAYVNKWSMQSKIIYSANKCAMVVRAEYFDDSTQCF